MRKSIIALSFCLFAAASGFPQWVNMKDIRVATLDVVSRVPDERIDTATLTEMVQVALVDKRAFLLVERSRVSEVLREQEFQNSGLTETQIARIGAMAGANKILSLSISKFGGDYIFIVKSIDTSTAVVDLTDQVQSPSVSGFVELIPVLADRFVRKARGESIPPFRPGPAASAPAAPASPEPSFGGVPRAGLVSEWLFDGSVKDSAERRLSKVVDVKLGKDRFGKSDGAGYFNGKTSGISAGKVFSGPVSEWSVSLWFYSDRFGKTKKGVIRGPFLSNWNRWVQDGQRGFDFGHFYNADGDQSQLNVTVCDGRRDFQGAFEMMRAADYEKKYGKRWIHACLVVRGGNAAVYLDGQLLGTFPSGSAMVPDPDTPFWIGRSEIDQEEYRGGWRPINYFSGALDDLRIYDRALEEAEIVALLEEGR